MFDSLSKKLLGLILATGVLCILVVGSSLNLISKQQKMEFEVNSLFQVQESVDFLRSQLWGFLQYSDVTSFEQVEVAQNNLKNILNKSSQSNTELKSLIQMNASLESLLQEEKNNWNHVIEYKYSGGLEILHSRYNMIIQNMTEEVLFLVKNKIKNNEMEHSRIILFMGVKLIIFSLVIVGISWLIYKRFINGAKLLKYAFFDLSRGDFERKINHAANIDKEFISLVKICDRMRESLNSITINRNELQNEVDKKTKKLLQQKDELAYLASHDYLSGLLNRRVLEQKINDIISHSNKSEQYFSLLFIDIDKFKDINDTYGHDAGDEVIKIISLRLSEQITTSDFVGRVGGDEFVLCLNLKNSDIEISTFIDNLKKMLNHDVLYKDTIIEAKVSIGCAIFPDDANNLEELLKIADKGMYNEKKSISNYAEN